MLEQSGVSVAAMSENSGRSVMLPRQNPSRLEVLVLPGSCLKGNGICEPFWSGPDASQQLQNVLSHATPAGKLYILVGLRRCDRAAYQRSSIPGASQTMTLKSARGCMISREPFRQLLSEVPGRSIR